MQKLIEIQLEKVKDGIGDSLNDAEAIPSVIKKRKIYRNSEVFKNSAKWVCFGFRVLFFRCMYRSYHESD